MSTESFTEIHFSFGPHGKEVLHLIPALRTEVEQFFDCPPTTRRVYLQEDATAKYSINQRIQAMANRGIPLVEAHIRAFGKIAGNNSIIIEREKYHQHMSNSEGAFGYQVILMLSDLKKAVVFDWDSESYPDLLAEQRKKSMQYRRKLVEKVTKFFIGGNFTELETTYRKYLMDFAPEIRLRNNGIARRLTSYAEEAQKGKRPTRIFARFGSHHDILPQYLDKATNGRIPKPALTYTYAVPNFIRDPEDALLLKIEIDEKYKPSRDEVLQSFFGHAMATIMKEVGREMYLSHKLACEMVDGYSLPDLKRKFQQLIDELEPLLLAKSITLESDNISLAQAIEIAGSKRKAFSIGDKDINPVRVPTQNDPGSIKQLEDMMKRIQGGF